MNAASVVTLDAHTLAALRARMCAVGNNLSISNIASQAIRTWLADHPVPCGDGAFDAGRFDAGHTGSAVEAVAGGARGYQWKELFLPEGTELRMRYNAEVHHARVTGDAIMYQGRSVSPRQLTIAVAGDGRNAWRDLSLRLPGEQHFRPASLLRRTLQAAFEGQRKAGADPATGSPAAAIAAAAAAMSEALRSALALVEHSNAQAVRKYERRADSHRRAADVMGDYAMSD